VEHEGEPLGRRQGVQHHQQRQPDPLGQQRLLLGVAAALGADDRVGHAQVEGLLAPGPAAAEHVQAHPGHHRGQPAAQVLDPAGVGAAEPQPGLLDGVVGLAERAEHPVGHRPQAGPLLLEPLGQPWPLVHHVTSLRRRVSSQSTRQPRRM
jgi:hypothetical protein